MKKSILIIAAGLMASISIDQQQIQNGGFENWENVPGGSEPVNWNSFLTAGGFFSNLADNQIEESTDVRPGSTGSKSIKIWSRTPLPGLVANGNLTLGRSEEHTSELQSRPHLVCRLLLEKKTSRSQ